MRKFQLLKDLPGIDAGTILVEEVTSPEASELFIGGYSKKRAGLLLYTDEAIGETLSINGVDYATADVENWLEEIKTEENKRWRAEADETYYYVDNDTEVCLSFEDHHPIDDVRHRYGNYFRTEEEAKAYAEYLKALTVVRDDAKGFKPDWANNTQCKFYVYYSHRQKRLSFECLEENADNGVFGLPYFAEPEDAVESIDKHEKEWKIIFGIKDREED